MQDHVQLWSRDQEIQRRITWFRNLVVAVVVAAGAVVASAVVARPTPLLAGLMLPVPRCGAFLVNDSRLLRRWRTGLLAQWAAGGLVDTGS